MDDKEVETPAQGFSGQIQKIRYHMNTYPYVWGSYAVVFGGLGIYTAIRWRAMRKVEDQLLKFDEKLKKLMTPEELEQAIKESQSRSEKL